MNELFQILKENISFVLVCVAAAAVIAGLSILAEKTLLKGKTNKIGATRRTATCAMLAAAAGLLMLFEFPIPFIAPSFYEADLSELPVLIGSFSMGPTAGVIIELVKVFVKLIIKGTSTAFVGDFANFFIGCTMIVPASIVYHMKKSKGMAALALGVGTICMTVFGSAFNAVYLIPKFSELFGVSLKDIIVMGQAINPNITDVTTMALWAVAPFNIIKGLGISVITMFIYKPLSSLIQGKR